MVEPEGITPDSIPVQLTRMEGVLNLINHQLDGILRRLEAHETRINGLELSVQRLGDAAVANERTVEQTAKALKDAKTAADEQARAEMQKSNQNWTPIARFLAATTGVLGIVAFYFAIRPGG